MKAKIKAIEGSGKAGKLPFELRGFVALAKVAISGAVTSLMYLYVFIIFLWNLCARSENVTGKIYQCLSVVRVYPCLFIVPRVYPSIYNTAYPFFVTNAELLHIRDTV